MKLHDSLLRIYAQYEVDISPIPKVGANDLTIQRVLGIVFGIVGALSVLFFVIGGFRYITAQGDPQQLSKAKQTLIYAIAGAAVSISAVGIVGFITGGLF